MIFMIYNIIINYFNLCFMNLRHIIYYNSVILNGKSRDTQKTKKNNVIWESWKTILINPFYFIIIDYDSIKPTRQ